MKYIALLTLLLAACSSGNGQTAPASQPAAEQAPVKVEVPPGMAVATFAGGCFWCMEGPFEKLDGVQSVISGYTAGHQNDPTYPEVSAGTTGHTEAVQVVFDPNKITYARLLEVFWHNIDPTAKNRQFCDVGSQYRSGIYFHDEEQKKLAAASLAKVGEQLKQPVHTELQAASVFYPAEGYHQDYYKKNPDRYQRYREGCGRDRRLKELWGDAAGH